MMSASNHSVITSGGRFRLRRTGFTLIELMVVMLIMGAMLSLVGPLAVRNVESAKYKTEEMQFKNWLVKMSHTAFYSGQRVTIDLEGKLASATLGERKDSLEFESLFFQPQQFTLSKNGFPSVGSVLYQERDKTVKLDIIEHIYEKGKQK
jgi:prepilin-type N-terminal cleavage/methylation domain-containing protein